MVIIQTYAARDSPQWNILIADKRKKNRMNCVKSQKVPIPSLMHNSNNK